MTEMKRENQNDLFWHFKHEKVCQNWHVPKQRFDFEGTVFSCEKLFCQNFLTSSTYSLSKQTSITAKLSNAPGSQEMD